MGYLGCDTRPRNWGAPQTGYRPYCYSVARYLTVITTQFDQFMQDLLTWLDSAWYVWVAMALCLALVVTIVVVSRARARIRRRIPQYRRQLS